MQHAYLKKDVLSWLAKTWQSVASLNPTLTAGCVCNGDGDLTLLWCDLGCWSRTVVVIKAAENLRLLKCCTTHVV